MKCKLERLYDCTCSTKVDHRVSRQCVRDLSNPLSREIRGIKFEAEAARNNFFYGYRGETPHSKRSLVFTREMLYLFKRSPEEFFDLLIPE